MEQKVPDEIGQAFAAYFKNLNEGVCPHCQQAILQEKQVGRCVYALPCYHRLYQGTARVKEKTWKDHPFFKEGIEMELTVKEVAQLLGVSPRTISSYVAKGKLTPRQKRVKVTTVQTIYVFDRAEVEKLQPEPVERNQTLTSISA